MTLRELLAIAAVATGMAGVALVLNHIMLEQRELRLAAEQANRCIPQPGERAMIVNRDGELICTMQRPLIR